MNLEKLIAKNLLRFGVKNLNESASSKLQILSEQNENEKVLEKTINFDSGKWSAAAGNIKGLLDPQMADIEDFLRKNGASSKLVTIVLEASESYVPNYDTEVKPKKPLAPKELSKRRYDTIETYMSSKLAQWQQAGLIPTNPAPKIEKLEPKTGGPKWSPPAGASQEQIGQLVNSKQYTDHQYLRMFIKVTAEQNEPVPLNQITQTVTNRDAISTWYDRTNSVFFYSYSIAAATMMGVDYKTLPSQLLTMNKTFTNRDAMTIGDIIIPKVTIGIEPESPTEQEVIVFDKNGNFNYPHKAQIASTYKLNIPAVYKQGTPEWKGAWLFACAYCTGLAQLDDWNRISNKPEGIDWRVITAIKKIPGQGLQSPAGQLQYFTKGGKFAQELVEQNWIEENDVNLPFETLYKKAVKDVYENI